ncbi:hypothetical protein LINGRAPRIM_LOCUS2770, partial [Linum grandiflorum]
MGQLHVPHGRTKDIGIRCWELLLSVSYNLTRITLLIQKVAHPMGSQLSDCNREARSDRGVVTENSPHFKVSDQAGDVSSSEDGGGGTRVYPMAERLDQVLSLVDLVLLFQAMEDPQVSSRDHSSRVTGPPSGDRPTEQQMEQPQHRLYHPLLENVAGFTESVVEIVQPPLWVGYCSAS